MRSLHLRYITYVFFGLLLSIGSPLVLIAQSDKQPASITFGINVCLSGPCAFSGENALHGAFLAAEDLNQKGGILGHVVKFAVEDSQDALSGARAISAFRALRNNKEIHFFIGPSWTPGLLGLAPVVSKDPEVLMITSNGGVNEFHEAGQNLFNSRGVDETTTRELARLAFRLGAKRMAIFGGQQAWELAQGAFFEDELKKLGTTLLLKLEPSSEMGNLNSEALKLVNAKPEAILFSSYLQLDLILKALQSLRYSGLKLIAFIDDSRISLAGSALEGAISNNPLHLSDDFTARLQKSYPRTKPDWNAHTTYDTVMLYAKAITAANSFEVSKVREALSQAQIDGVSGAFRFDGGRLAIRSSESFQIVKGGKLVAYEAPNK